MGIVEIKSYLNTMIIHLDASLEFSFYAYDIEGLEFTHSISSVASADSSFNGKFEILDYILDSRI